MDFKIAEHVDWLNNEDVRPYVYLRPENKAQIHNPGSRHKVDWFRQPPVYINPLDMDAIDFAEQIYFIENNAFGPSNMPMPRWVFYDCAVMPGFVGGFAYRTKALPEAIRKVLKVSTKLEWTPLSLFIVIPTMSKGEWLAHNLCSINSMLEKDDRLYGLGFLTKAFSLWYANIDGCCGMTQWGTPAIKLHSHYGHMRVVASYTPVHSHAKTLTYRVNVDAGCWEQFFTKKDDYGFLENYEPAGFEIDRKDEKSMIALQRRLDRGEGPFYLSAIEIANKNITDSLTIYTPKTKG